MIFNNRQIDDMVGILRRWQYLFIAKHVGLDFLTQSEIDILVASGVNVDKYKNSKGIIEHAFLFGILAEAIGDTRAKKMNYKQFLQFLKSGNFVPLTEQEENALDYLKNRAYTDITSLGNRIVTGTRNTILKSNFRQQAAIRQQIKDKAIQAVQLRKGARYVASELGNLTQDWGRDWLRIAYYLLHEAYNVGRAESIFKQHGPDAKVYFDVYPGACAKCRELYLEDPEDPTSRPKLFRLADLIANGNNIGRKAAEWLPTIDPTHPYCFNNPATKVYTINGWRNISSLKKGDMVLTHRGRFRPVTEVIIHDHKDEPLYDIYYAVKNLLGRKKVRKVRRITGNHPILSNGEWREAASLKTGDLITIEGVCCEKCGSFMPIYVSASDTLLERGLCIACHRSEQCVSQWQDTEFRSYMSKKVKEEMAVRYANMSAVDRQKLTTRARKAIEDKYQGEYPWMAEALKKANSTNGKKRSFIERKLEYLCKSLGVEAKTGVFLKNNGKFRNDVVGYFPDLLIPDLKIVLEADGEKWHNDPEYDSNRDKDILECYGYETFRFTEDEINNHGDMVYNRLKRLFKNHRGQIVSRGVKVLYIKQVPRSKKYTKLYNISVAEDESYIADGIVVHNCRCTVNHVSPGYDWDPTTRAFTKPVKRQFKDPKLKNVKLNIKVTK